MTLNSPTLWVVILVAAMLLVMFLLRRREGQGPTLDRERIMQQTREVAEEAARDAAVKAAGEAQDAAVRAYQQQQQELREEQATRRREGAARAQETKKRRIESLKPWREPFVQFVRRLAEPFFSVYSVDDVTLDEWAEERADVYIARKPYVLEIVQSIHADAQRAAAEYSNKRSKSPRELARERAKALSQSLVRNKQCPYCGLDLDEKAHIDHIRPVQRGGPSVAWNMVFVCIPCNRAKRDLSLVEFLDGDYARRNGLRISDVLKRLKALDKEIDILL